MPRVNLDGQRLSFICPACDDVHRVSTLRWSFNADFDAPTIIPSLHVRGYQIRRSESGRWDGWVRDESGQLVDSVCHCIVTDGRITYLPDCTHAMRGQTVDLPEWPW